MSKDIADPETFVEQLAEGAVAPWSPISWRELEGDPSQVVVTFEFDGDDERERRFGPEQHTPSVRAVIDELAEEHEAGAPVGDVIDRLAEAGMTDPRKRIEELQRRGDIYEPREDYLRTV